jgi:hypothetical protein
MLILRITKAWVICDWLAKFIKVLPLGTIVNIKPCEAEAAAIIEHSPFKAAVIINNTEIRFITLSFQLVVMSISQTS